jgi:hypothetical protein
LTPFDTVEVSSRRYRASRTPLPIGPSGALVEFEKQAALRIGAQTKLEADISGTVIVAPIASSPLLSSIDFGPKPEILRSGTEVLKPPSALYMLWRLSQTPNEFTPDFELINETIEKLSLSKTGAEKMHRKLIEAGCIEQNRTRCRITERGVQRFADERIDWEDQIARWRAKLEKTITAPEVAPTP